VTFFRRLAAVLVVVAAVVALGVAWEHSSEAGWITPPQDGRIPVNEVAAPPPGGAVHRGVVFHRNPAAGGQGPGLSFSDTGNLTRTAEIEAAVVAGVVVLDVIRRRQRRARRTPR
jgi:hypothetical protein